MSFINDGFMWVTDHATVLAAVVSAVATVVVASFTIVLSRATVGLFSTSNAQSKAMERSIREAAKSAEAMEGVAKSMAKNTELIAESVSTSKQISQRVEMQMRAYLSVVVGGGSYQEMEKNIRFEGKPLLLNTGNTPAHKVQYKAKAAILRAPLPQDFTFPLEDAPLQGGGVLGPRQQFVLSAIVEGFCNPAEVNDVKIAKDKALYVWGVVTYEDVFGKSWETRFCQIITWLPDNRIFGYYTDRHNTAT